ncbi:MAG TPA: hypothetical protein VNI01_10955 [Elusimicrobiota bacterium]|nr:hypothetical protein [Elusimicrobiota bacterium]
MSYLDQGRCDFTGCRFAHYDEPGLREEWLKKRRNTGFRPQGCEKGRRCLTPKQCEYLHPHQASLPKRSGGRRRGRVSPSLKATAPELASPKPAPPRPAQPAGPKVPALGGPRTPDGAREALEVKILRRESSPADPAASDRLKGVRSALSSLRQAADQMEIVLRSLDAMQRPLKELGNPFLSEQFELLTDQMAALSVPCDAILADVRACRTRLTPTAAAQKPLGRAPSVSSVASTASLSGTSEGSRPGASERPSSRASDSSDSRTSAGSRPLTSARARAPAGSGLQAPSCPGPAPAGPSSQAPACAGPRKPARTERALGSAAPRPSWASIMSSDDEA